MKDLVSVIVPVYNVERYLTRCLDSIIRQSYNHLEIILVDDGSTDSSGVICDKYSKTDSRIKVIHCSNRGASSARNKGLEVANGEFVYFVDSDDIISKNAIDILVKLITGFDMAFSGHVICDIDGTEGTRWQDNHKDPHKWNHEDALKLMFDCSSIKGLRQNYCYIGYCFNKLYRRSIIEKYNIRFNEKIYYNEDRLFVVEYLLHSDFAISTKVITYKYLINSRYATHRKSLFQSENFTRIKTEFDAFNIMIGLLGNTYANYSCIYTSFKRAIKLWLMILNDSNKDRKIYVKKLICRFGNMMIQNRQYYKMPYLLIAYVCNILLK